MKWNGRFLDRVRSDKENIEKRPLSSEFGERGCFFAVAIGYVENGGYDA